MKTQIIRGEGSVSDARMVIVVSRFNERVTDALLEGALHTLGERGVGGENIAVIRVPGAFELSAAARWAIEARQPDAVIALGAVIRGETPHFDHICSACAHGLSQVAADYDVPLSFGVLTADTAEQAVARAGGAKGNKGVEAAEAALEMLALRRQLLP